MDSEIDLAELIKSRRYFKMALSKLLTEKELMELEERSRYLCIDPDSD